MDLGVGYLDFAPIREHLAEGLRVKLAEGPEPQHRMEAEHCRGFKNKRLVRTGFVVVIRLFITREDEGFSGVWRGWECPPDAAHDRTEKRGV